jgi:hypothetical protein
MSDFKNIFENNEFFTLPEITEAERNQFRMQTVSDFNEKLACLYKKYSVFCENNWENKWIYKEERCLEDKYETVCRQIFEIMTIIYFEQLNLCVSRSVVSKGGKNLDLLVAKNKPIFYVECTCPDKGVLYLEHSPHEYKLSDGKPGPMGIGEMYSRSTNPNEESRKNGLRWTNTLASKKEQIENFLNQKTKLPVILIVNSIFTNDHPIKTVKFSDLVASLFGFDPTPQLHYSKTEDGWNINSISVNSRVSLQKNENNKEIDINGFLNGTLQSISAIIHINWSPQDFLNNWYLAENTKSNFDVIKIFNEQAEIILNTTASLPLPDEIINNYFAMQKIYGNANGIRRSP